MFINKCSQPFLFVTDGERDLRSSEQMTRLKLTMRERKEFPPLPLHEIACFSLGLLLAVVTKFAGWL